MVLSGLRSVVLLFLVFTVISCQKELDENGYESCLLERVEVYYGSASEPSEVYGYEYNPVSMQFSGLHIEIPALGYSRHAAVSVSAKGIMVEGLAKIELDGSRRITHLETIGDYPGSQQGDYFFGYNNTGFLEERLFDDGNLVLERTVYDNDGTGFTHFHKKYESDPKTVQGEFTYGNAGTQPGNVLLPYGDVFPELVPFFPMVRLGKISPLPLERVSETLESPAGPPLTADYLYNGYGETDAGSLASFESRMEKTGRPPLTRKFRLTYTCN